MLNDMTTIEWNVRTPDGTDIRGRFAIDAERAADLWPDRPPVAFDAFGADAEWQRRRDSAEAMARAISKQIANDILHACDPEWRRDLWQKTHDRPPQPEIR
jgi:hypothetical protein